jgi:hypothetical protein
MQAESHLLPSDIGEWSIEAVGRDGSQVGTFTMRAIFTYAPGSDRRIVLVVLTVSTDQQLRKMREAAYQPTSTKLCTVSLTIADMISKKFRPRRLRSRAIHRSIYWG